MIMPEDESLFEEIQDSGDNHRVGKTVKEIRW